MRVSYKLINLSILISFISCKPNEPQAVKSIEILTQDIICDKFEVITKLTGSKLNLYLITDLPSNTDLMVSISRTYLEKGSSIVYGVDYFTEKSTVGAWKESKTISLKNDLWMKELKEKQVKLKPLGLGFEVGSINKKISVDFTVPINQTDSKFGKWNSNLKGKAITKEGNWNLIRNEIELDYPLNK